MDVWTVLLSWGVLQGVLLAAALTFPGRRRGPGDLTLAALLVTFSIVLTEYCAIRLGIYVVDAHRFIVFVTTPLLFLPGPLFYAYARTLRDGRSAIALLWPHFIPAAAMAVNYAPTYIALIARALGVDPGRIPAPGQLVWINGYVAWGAEIVQLALYLIASRPVLGSFEAALRRATSLSSAIRSEWLRRLALMLLGVTIVNIAALIGMVTGRHVAGIEYVMALAYALGVHGVAFLALRDPRVFGWIAEPYEAPAATAPAEFAAPAPAQPAAQSAAPEEPEGLSVRPAAYAKSGLTAERRQTLRERLVRFMETQQPWLDENLTLAGLARQAAIPPAHVSEVLSLELKTNFFAFVNRYRVDEACRRLAETSGEAGSILRIAMACGFSSKSSFNRIFKRVTGSTPSGFARHARTVSATNGETARRLGRPDPPPPATLH